MTQGVIDDIEKYLFKKHICIYFEAFHILLDAGISQFKALTALLMVASMVCQRGEPIPSSS